MQALQFKTITPLELVMRDALAGLDDFVSGHAFQSGVPGTFEILAIEPAESQDMHRRTGPGRRSSYA